MMDAASTQDAGDLPTIGFVGLGNMGLPMCLRLVAAGDDVTAFDIRPGRARRRRRGRERTAARRPMRPGVVDLR